MISFHYTNNCSSPFSLFWYQSHFYTMSSIPSSSSLTSIQIPASIVIPDPNITHSRQRKLPLWRFQFLPLLKLHDIEGLVNGFSPCPVKDAQPTINPKYTRSIKLDQMLLCWLISSLTEDVLAHVVDLTTSRDVLCSLERIFAPLFRARVQ